jgi:hypothetical protein
MTKRSIAVLVLGATFTLGYLAWPPPTTLTEERQAANESSPGEIAPPAKETGEAIRGTEHVDAATASEHAPPGCVLEARYLLNADGTTTTVYACPDLEPAHEHPYASYSTEALASLAYADGKAAETLGMRLRESDEQAALSLILRASALTGGNPSPILTYSNAYPQPTAIDGVPVRKTVRTKFVLSAVAEMLGADRNNLPHWENEIRRVSMDPDREIEQLMERARELIDEMRRIELDVTGTSTFGGQSDA